MGSRKRLRPNPKGEVKASAAEAAEESSASTPSNSHGTPRDATSSKDDVTLSSGVSDSDAASISQVMIRSTYCLSFADSVKLQKNRSWYAGGTWPRMQKSTPSIKVARETILADKTSSPVSADFSKFEPKKPHTGPVSSSTLKPPSMSLGKGKETLDMTLPTTQAQVEDTSSKRTEREEPVTHENYKTNTLHQHDSTDDPKRPNTASGWMGWLGMTKTEDMSRPEQHPTFSDSNVEVSLESAPPDINTGKLPATVPEHDELVDSSSGASWFGFWPASPREKFTKEVKAAETVLQIDHQHDMTAEVQPSQVPTTPTPGSTWAFWSKESPNPRRRGTTTDEAGALAIKGESSQDKPVPAHASAPNETTKVETIKQRKRGRPQSIIDDTAQKGDASKKPTFSEAIFSPNAGSTPKLAQIDLESKKATPSQSPGPSKPLPTNLLLPPFHDTYHLMENPSIIQQIARLIMHGRDSPTSHVHLLREPPKIRKALAIGIHGLFPAALLRTVIGQPTGTSIRFANHAAAAIHRWAEQHGYGDGDVEVEKIALEGEGKIAERVDNLWKLLLNWIDHVRTADFILVACHSQGVPVAVMLVAKLVEFGVITSARVGICAMGECILFESQGAF